MKLKFSKKILTSTLGVCLLTGGLGVYAGTIIDSYQTVRGNTATVEEEQIHKNRIGITVNGQEINQDTWYANGVTYAPLRAVAETAGASVDYNTSTQSANIKTSAPSQITGVWEGTYTANQVEIKATLTFLNETVNFSFEPTAKNPEVPKGSFTMLPEYDNKTGFIKLEGVKWIQKPSGYSMVDFTGSISPSGYINGVVTGENSKAVAGTFSVKRVK